MKISRFEKLFRSYGAGFVARLALGVALALGVSQAAAPLPSKAYALAGAKVSIERLGLYGKRSLVWQEQTRGGKTLKDAGGFTLHRNALDPQSLYLIEVRGGKVLDADLDGRIDPHPAPNRATLHLIARGSTLKGLPRIVVSFTSELLYERVAARLRQLRDPGQIASLLDQEAAKILRKDLGGDGRITAADIALFVPTRDREALRPVYAKQYAKLAAYYQRRRPILPNLSEALFEIPWKTFKTENIRGIKLLDHEKKALLLHDGNLTLFDIHDPGTPTPLFTWRVSKEDDAPLLFDADWTQKRIYILDDTTFRVLRMDREGTELARFESAHPANGGMDDFALSKDRIFLLVDGGITVIDRATLKKLFRSDLKLPLSGEEEAIRVSPDGRLLLVNWNGNWLKAFRVHDDRISKLSTITKGADVKDFALLDDGRKLVLIDAQQGILLYDLHDPIHPGLLDRLGALSTKDGGIVFATGSTVALTLYNTWETSKALLFSVEKGRFETIGEVDFSVEKVGEEPADWEHHFELLRQGEVLMLFGGMGMKVIDTTLIDRRLYALSTAPFGSLAERFSSVGGDRVYGIVRTANTVCQIDWGGRSTLRYRSVYSGDPDEDDFFDIAAGPRFGEITIADQNQGIRIFRIEGERLIEKPHELMDTGAGAVAVVDPDHLLVFEVTGDSDTEGLALYRILRNGKGSLSFRRLNRIHLPGALGIRYDSRHRLAYVWTEKNGIRIVRITPKYRIVKLGKIDQTTNDLLQGKDRISVASSDGVRIYSRRSRHPRLEAFIPLPEAALSLALDAQKNRLFVGTEQGLYVYDLQTRHRLARYPVGRVSAIHLLPEKNAALLGGMEAGVMAIDLSLLE
ncbi:hypothetical protein [Nitratifractor sp.]